MREDIPEVQQQDPQRLQSYRNHQRPDISIITLRCLQHRTKVIKVCADIEAYTDANEIPQTHMYANNFKTPKEKQSQNGLKLRIQENETLRWRMTLHVR